ncbi:MAG: DUF433 domain-containing protein [Pseudonocardiaceae bacterium]
MSNYSVRGVEVVLGRGNFRCDSFDFDVFAGEGGVFKLVATPTPTQCTEAVPRPAELGAHGVTDRTVLLGQPAAGRDAREVLTDFPDLEPNDILAALEYAAAAVQERELPLAAR